MCEIKLTNCKSCGKELGKRQKFYCSNTCKLTDPDNIKSRTSKKEKQDESKLIKCIHTGKVFKDIKNYSGVLTRHIENIAIDSYNVKCDLFDNFEIIDNPDFLKPKYQCKYCDWKTVDVNNKSGCITNHLKDNHNINPQQHIEFHKEDSYLFIYSLRNDVNEKLFDSDSRHFIKCEICKKRFKKLSNSHLSTHGITTEQYRLKYNIEILSSSSTVDKSRENYKVNYDNINKIKKTSKKEQEVVDFIISLGINVKQSLRGVIYPFEVDLFLPDYNIAIEYNGLSWHSEFFGNKTKHYHVDKTIKCEEKGIRLITIFEDEWINKNEIVKSKIKHILGLNGDKIFARKCYIKEIDPPTKNAFLNINHIQGEDRSNINIGLYYKDELVSVMTFSYPKMMMGYKSGIMNEYELSRFASSKHVIGGSSKMLKYFIKNYNPVRIFSFADRRWTFHNNQTVYDKIGFKLVKINKPTFFWLKHHRTRYHRFTFNKQRIVNELGGNPNLTEVENMRLMGYDRIWDCGSLKYEMILR